MKPLETTALSWQKNVLRSHSAYQSLPITDANAEVIDDGRRKQIATVSAVVCIVSIVLVASICCFSTARINSPILLPAAKIVPFSSADPRDLGFKSINRSAASQPAKIFADLRNQRIPLPTNAWCENLFLGDCTRDTASNAFQLPYIVDTSGVYQVKDCIFHSKMNSVIRCNVATTKQGLRTHAVRVQSNDRTVMVQYKIFRI